LVSELLSYLVSPEAQGRMLAEWHKVPARKAFTHTSETESLVAMKNLETVVHQGLQEAGSGEVRAVVHALDSVLDSYFSGRLGYQEAANGVMAAQPVSSF
jgi:hypothetical protein